MLKMNTTLQNDNTREHWIAHYDAMQPCFAGIHANGEPHTFFQWVADKTRIHVTRTLTESGIFTQNIVLLLPDYDEEEDSEEDWQCVLPSYSSPFHSEFHVKPTSNPDMVALTLAITPEMVATIPFHFPANLQFQFPVIYITINITKNLVTDIGF